MVPKLPEMFLLKCRIKYFSAGFQHVFEAAQKGFPGDSVVKNLPANSGDTGDMGLIPGSGGSPGGVNGNPCQYSCLGNPKDRGEPERPIHGVMKSWTRLTD